MKREIIFRGKRKDTGRWIEGGYIEWTDYKGNKWCQIVSSNGYNNDVIPETIGQFSGLHDKNGMEIYEGDIVYCSYKKKKYLVSFENGCYVAKAPKNKEGFVFSYGREWSELEIIGNIHDNSELL